MYCRSDDIELVSWQAGWGCLWACFSANSNGALHIERNKTEAFAWPSQSLALNPTEDLWRILKLSPHILGVDNLQRGKGRN